MEQIVRKLTEYVSVLKKVYEDMSEEDSVRRDTDTFTRSPHSSMERRPTTHLKANPRRKNENNNNNTDTATTNGYQPFQLDNSDDDSDDGELSSSFDEESDSSNSEGDEEGDAGVMVRSSKKKCESSVSFATPKRRSSVDTGGEAERKFSAVPYYRLEGDELP